MSSFSGRVSTLLNTLANGASTPELAPYLARMGLEKPASLRERFYRRLVAAAVKTAHGD
jgi:hypothetical protein